MSMVSYVLGMGDRHLDNILVDFSSGEVVHIDYNVCFEKGPRLRVPELAPFRKTQIMQAALGVYGVEGAFRTSSEHVMRVLRRNKETLLTLLEAFVYDPLVDWTAEKEAHDQEACRNMDVVVALILFASRIGEMKASMGKRADNFIGLLTKFRDASLALSKTANKLVRFEENIHTYTQQIKESQVAVNNLLQQEKYV